MPAARKPTGPQMDHALAQLQRAGGAMNPHRLDDPALNGALDPFRGHRPLRLRCPRTGCRGTIAWVALAPADARVIFSVNGPRKGYVARTRGSIPPAQLRPQPPAPYDYWSLGPTGGTDSAQPATRDPDDLTPLRWRFTCQRCGAPYTLTNQTMIIKLIEAMTGNAREFTP